MKLAKLSLAAILAAGTFSVANATSLQDAIQGVTLNGFLRIRYYNRTFKDSNTYNRWRTNGVFIFGVPVGDNLSMVYRASVQTNVYTDDDQLLPGTTNVDDFVHNDFLYMKYSNGPVNAIAGKIPVMTPVTSSDPYTPAHGAGAIASYNVGNGFTLAGAYVDALVNNDGYIEGLESTTTTPAHVDPVTGAIVPATTTTSDDTPIGSLGNTIYAIAAIYNSDMVSGQAWYFHATNLVKNLYTVQATVKPVDGLAIHGDFASSKLDFDGAQNKTYYNISAQYAVDGFCGKIGYASTDKDVGAIDFSADAPIGAVLPTANRYNIANMLDTDAYYAKLGYDVNANANLYAGYAKVDQSKNAGDNDSDEYMVGVKYKYNKKLGFNVYYDVLDFDHDNLDTDMNEFRFEARYNF